MAVIKKLCNIDRFKIELPKLEIKQEQIDEKVLETLKEHSIFCDTEGPIKEENIVYIDFTGKTASGDEFEGSDGDNVAAVVGDGQFMPDFEQQLLNHYKGDNFNITVTPDENHHIQAVRGKELIFNVTINRISTKKLPQLDDFFVKTLRLQNVNTIDDFKMFIQEAIKLEFLSISDEKSRNMLVIHLISNSDFEISKEEIDDEAKKIVKMFEKELLYEGVILNEYLKAEKITIKDLELKYRNQAIDNIKTRTIIVHLIDILNIEVSDEELVNEAEKLELEYGYSINELVNTGFGNKETFRSNLKRKKVIETLLGKTEIIFK